MRNADLVANASRLLAFATRRGKAMNISQLLLAALSRQPKNALYRLRHRVEKTTRNRASRPRSCSAHTPCKATMGRVARPGGRGHVDAPPPQLCAGVDIRVAFQASVAFLHRTQFRIQNPQPSLPPLPGRSRPGLKAHRKINRA